MAELTTRHKLIPLNSLLLPMKDQMWGCSCGKWQHKIPELGPFGRTTGRARMAQLQMAFDAHAKWAEIKRKKEGQ